MEFLFKVVFSLVDFIYLIFQMTVTDATGAVWAKASHSIQVLLRFHMCVVCSLEDRTISNVNIIWFKNIIDDIPWYCYTILSWFYSVNVWRKQLVSRPYKRGILLNPTFELSGCAACHVPGGNVSFMRLFRLFKITKILRTIRIIKARHKRQKLSFLVLLIRQTSSHQTDQTGIAGD